MADNHETPDPSVIHSPLEAWAPLAEPDSVPVINDLLIAEKFINLLKNASLDLPIQY
jgi:hypothetical protein